MPRGQHAALSKASELGTLTLLDSKSNDTGLIEEQLAVI
ncbi:hypothetical protein SVI_0474 [Shewanella violacea DSS12]|uniref:Uncharacterized protein n=1 Tax=Shewanella violacea (strain JCM 10179 / CIP 106290 / LMG 19151 / DSS12) TaxID=637905 RepID=D4ZFJ6_SHEVD|nr:hypothetical protein SVI_0474 [Shewanella violacea DSS12]